MQRVQIGAKSDRATAASAAIATQHADDAGLGHPGVHFEPEGAQLFGDKCAGLGFLEGRLGMRVDMMPPLSHFGNECVDFREGFHGGASAKDQEMKAQC